MISSVARLAVRMPCIKKFFGLAAVIFCPPLSYKRCY
jgi:hypothetical protein